MSSGTVLPLQPRPTIPTTVSAHGLTQTVTFIDEPNRPGADAPAWVGGFEFFPQVCKEARLWDSCRPVEGQLVRVRGPINAEGEFVPNPISTAPGVTQLTITDNGGGLYDLAFTGAPEIDTIMAACLDGNDPDAILVIEIALAEGGIQVLEMPFSQTGAPTGAGAVSLNTNLGFTTALLPNRNADVLAALVEGHGSPAVLGADASAITLRAIRCDSVLAAPGAQKVIDPNQPSVIWNPYTVYSAVSCGQKPEHSELDARSEIELNAGTSKAIECELWDGALKGAVNPFCVEPNPSLVGEVELADIGNPVLNIATGQVGTLSSTRGLGTLIQIAANSGVGAEAVIHASHFVVNAWMAADLLVEVGSVLRTRVGKHKVIAGAGYSGSAPLSYRAAAAAGGFDARPANSHWAYVTSEVQAMATAAKDETIDNPQVGSAHAQKSKVLENRYIVIFEREALAFWDTCLTGAVLIDLCQDAC